MEDNECQTSKTMIDGLPDECLERVLGHLTCLKDRNTFALTCRRWFLIEGSTRKSLRVCGPSVFAPAYDPILLPIFRRFPSLVSLSFPNCVELSDSALLLFQMHCPHLRRLALDCCLKITDHGLEHVGNSCHQLQFLSLYRCAVSDNGCSFIARGCPLLQTLNLSHCQGITDVGISALSLSCCMLKDVTISYCKNISGEGFSLCSSLERLEADSCRLADSGIQDISRKCSALQHLKLSHSLSGIRLSSFGVSNIGTFCKNLKVLNLRMCRFIDNFAVIKIATGCFILEDLNLAVCEGVTFEGWEAIAVMCKNLQTLHANRCRNFCDRSILALRNGCNNLRFLYLHGCPNLSRAYVELFKQSRSQVKILSVEHML